MLHLAALIGLAAGGIATGLVTALLAFIGVDASIELVQDLAAKRHYTRKEGRS